MAKILRDSKNRYYVNIPFKMVKMEFKFEYTCLRKTVWPFSEKVKKISTDSQAQFWGNLRNLRRMYKETCSASSTFRFCFQSMKGHLLPKSSCQIFLPAGKLMQS